MIEQLGMEDTLLLASLNFLTILNAAAVDPINY
jgi:hypothetical protein